VRANGQEVEATWANSQGENGPTGPDATQEISSLPCVVREGVAQAGKMGLDLAIRKALVTTRGEEDEYPLPQ
jgi:hypothetical protein